MLSSDLTVLSGGAALPFRETLQFARLPLPSVDARYEFVVGDVHQDDTADLLVINKRSGVYSYVDISVLPGTTGPSGQAPFTWFETQSSTPLYSLSVDFGFDFASISLPQVSDDGIGDVVAIFKLPGGSPDVIALSGNPTRPATWFGYGPMAFSAFSRTADQSLEGLTASFVNRSLRSYQPQDDWRTSQTISGTRVDARVDFPGNSLGSRSAVGLTRGSDANWDFFSVQWDGFITIPADGVRLRMVNTDGSRLWIDLNNDGTFGSSGTEFINNGWGSGRQGQRALWAVVAMREELGLGACLSRSSQRMSCLRTLRRESYGTVCRKSVFE